MVDLQLCNRKLQEVMGRRIGLYEVPQFFAAGKGAEIMKIQIEVF